MTSERIDLTPAVDLAAKNKTRHPNESDEYRHARQRLLVEEIELRRNLSASPRFGATFHPAARFSVTTTSWPRTAPT